MFCTHGLQAVKSILHKLTPALEKIIDQALTFTALFLNIADMPGISTILAAILPGEPALIAAAHQALKYLTAVDEILKETDPQKAIEMFIQDISKLDPLGQHGMLIKWASIISSILHQATLTMPTGASYTESVYDSLTQMKAVVMNAENKATTNQ